nr:tfiia large subunit [Hymenolepis microstoma]
MSEIAVFFNKVIDEVIDGVRDAFIQDGVDLDVLEQLKKLWVSKFADTHVTDPEPVAQPASHYARVLGPQLSSVSPVPIARMPLQLPVPGSLRNLAPIARPNAPLPTVPVASNATQQTGLVVSPAHQQRPAIVLASALNTQSSNSQAAFANIAFRPQPAASGQLEATVETAAIKTSRRKQKKPLRGGGHEDEHIPDYPSATKQEDDELPPPPPDEPEDGAEGEEEEEDEPLNSEDDVSDEDADLIFRSDDLVVCQYERFTRARSRWRFWLRDGIMKIKGREQVFQRLLVEADWMYNSQQHRTTT